MQRYIRTALYAAAFLVPPAVIGYTRQQSFVDHERFELGDVVINDVPAPAYDPARPTVVVLLGNGASQITDVLAPYEMFARTGKYNVYTVAPERKPALLTNGLRVLPHFGLRDLRGTPNVVVVPNIIPTRGAENRPVIEFIQEAAQQGALIFSWCTGAEALAEAGLLDGRAAIAHWGDLPRLKEQYPRVQWTSGVRWVDHDSLVLSAGLTSGIDATLRVIMRLNGDSVAERVARELHYPNLHFARDPAVEQYRVELQKDIVFPLNTAFRLGRERIGITLKDGVSESDIGYLYDAHVGSGFADVLAISQNGEPVQSQFGLTILPDLSADAARAASLDRVIDPSFSRNRFGLETVLEDLARHADVMTARFAERRLEYRSSNLVLAGRAAPWGVLATPLVLGLLSVLIVRALHKFGKARAIALAVLLVAAPSAAGAQSAPPNPGTRIRADVSLDAKKSQPVIGTLRGYASDTLLLAVSNGTELRIPQSAVRELFVSRGMTNRFLSAAQRAWLPALLSGAYTGVKLSIDRDDSDPRPLDGALQRAASAAAFSAIIGFIFPKERWTRVEGI